MWFNPVANNERRGSNQNVQKNYAKQGDTPQRFSLHRMQTVFQNLAVHTNYGNPAHQQRAVENIRELAEIVVYGEQNTQILFDYFAEKNIFQLFLSILRSPGCGVAVKVQVLQTVSILIQSVKTDTSLYFMLSNNHINEIILHDFNFQDEEITANFISLLKTLALKLNRETVQFFFNHQSFPLYDRATRFFNHPDGMVRTASWTITLSVLRVQDPAMRQYLLHEPSSSYFENVVHYLHHRCRVVHATLVRVSAFAWAAEADPEKSLSACGIQASDLGSPSRWWTRLRDGLGELQDDILYINDILCLGDPGLEDIVCDACMAYFVLPLVLASLVPNGKSVDEVGDFSPAEVRQSGLLRELMALSALHQTGTVFGLVLVAMLLFNLRSRKLTERLLEAMFKTSDGAQGCSSVRHHFFNALKHPDCEQLNLAAAMVLYAAIKNPSVRPTLLQQLNLAPAAVLSQLPNQQSVYPEEAARVILDLLHREKPPLHSMTVRALAKLLIELTIPPEGVQSALLAQEDLSRLSRCYANAVEVLQQVVSELPPSTFVQLFEEQWLSLRKGPLDLERLAVRPETMVPQSSALAGLLPEGMRDPEDLVARAGQAIQKFMIHRLLFTTVSGALDSKLSQHDLGSSPIKEGKLIDLRNCEYIPVQVKWGEPPLQKLRPAYLIVVSGSMVLAEPHRGALGRGVTKAVAPLHRTEALLDSSNLCVLHLCICSPFKVGGSSSVRPPKMRDGLPPRQGEPKRWYVTLVFSSPHNCVWARDELSKAKVITSTQKARSITQMLVDSFYCSTTEGSASNSEDGAEGQKGALNHSLDPGHVDVRQIRAEICESDKRGSEVLHENTTTGGETEAIELETMKKQETDKEGKDNIKGIDDENPGMSMGSELDIADGITANEVSELNTTTEISAKEVSELFDTTNEISANEVSELDTTNEVSELDTINEISAKEVSELDIDSSIGGNTKSSLINEQLGVSSETPITEENETIGTTVMNEDDVDGTHTTNNRSGRDVQVTTDKGLEYAQDNSELKNGTELLDDVRLPEPLESRKENLTEKDEVTYTERSTDESIDTIECTNACLDLKEVGVESKVLTDIAIKNTETISNDVVR